MKKLNLRDAEERKAELRRIIRGKCRSLSDCHLNFIVDHINTGRVYYIKILYCPVKFLNIVTEEYIATTNKKLYSVIIPLYGTFAAGHFMKSNSMRAHEPGQIEQTQPAAAVKISVDGEDNRISKTYSLVIYEPA